jgi:hypothetical protein
VSAAVLEQAAEPAPILRALRDMMGELPARAPEIDTHELEVAGVAEITKGLLARVLPMLRALETVTGGSVPDLDIAEPDAWGPSPRLPTLGDVCFAATFELRRAERELVQARTTTDVVIAIDLTLRKLRRAIRAILEAARDAGIVDLFGATDPRIADLDSGLAVRRLYAAFRASLREPTAQTPEAVMESMRYAAGAFATLLTSTDYADVRAADRTMLRALRERLLQWARNDRSVQTGLNIIADVMASGQLLRQINRRQELRAHDQAVARAFAALDLEAWLRRIPSVRGLDDTLDQLLDQLPTATQREELAATILARLRLLTGES